MKKLLLGLSFLASLNAADVTLDSGTSLLWQDNKTVKNKVFTHVQAQKFCEGLILGEYSDFRLPTIRELHTIVDYRNYDPVILKGFMNPKSDDFWSSTPYKYRKSDFWIIDFKKGISEITSGRNYKSLRCVQHLQ